MKTTKIEETRQRLLNEYSSLLTSINRGRAAAEEFKAEVTEEEGDQATNRRDRELLYKLHESDFQRLKFIKEAIDAIDRGQYGECDSCGKEITPKRLDAVPWATMCIRCMEEKEMEHVSSQVVLVGRQTDDID